MSVTMDDGIKRWTAKRKTALVIEIIQGKTTVAEASRSFEPPRGCRRVSGSMITRLFRRHSRLRRRPPLLRSV